MQALFLQDIHDLLWERLERLHAEYNPCRVEKGTCLRYQLRHSEYSFCCENCTHRQANKGLCAVRSMSCKAFLCPDALATLPEDARLLFIELRRATMHFRFDLMDDAEVNVQYALKNPSLAHPECNWRCAFKT